jgi:hypothetical protein
MGKKDSATKMMMKRRDIFADAFNTLFRRAGITVDMDSLEERDTVVTLPVNIGNSAEWVDRANDVAFEAFVRHVGDTDFVLLCVENQAEVAYDMPLRNLLTSGLQWWKYRTQLGNKNQEAKNLDKGGEFLSKMRKDDRLPPVVIMVLYLGLTPWTGPNRFQDMVSPTIPGLQQFMSDSPTNVVSLVDLTAEEVSHMKSPLRILTELLQTHGDKEAMQRIAREDPMFRDAPAIIFRVFNDLTNSHLTIPRKKEHNDMCKALDDLKEEGRAEGREEGRAEGREEGREEERKKARLQQENNIHNLVNSCEQQGFSFMQILKVLMDTFGLSMEKAMTYLPDPVN